jgi:hypothetical protein
MQKHETLPTK